MIDEEARLSEKFGRKRPFKVPEGYFDQLSDTILMRIAAEETSTHREPSKPVASLWQRMRKPLAVAAGVCALIGIGFGLLRQNVSQKPGKEIASTATPQTEHSQEKTSKEVSVPTQTQEASVLSNPFNQQTATTAEEPQSEPLKPARATDKQTVAIVSKTTPTKNNQSVAATVREEAQDILDAAADFMMIDADDLYAMLDDE